MVENWRESLKGEQMAKNIYGNTTRPDGSPLYEMSDADRVKLDTIRDKWIENAYRTDTMSDSDKSNAANALFTRYKEASLVPPKSVLFAQSPRDAVVLAGIYFGISYALRNNGECVKAFGRDFDLADFARAARVVYAGRSSVNSAAASAADSAVASVVASVADSVADSVVDSAADSAVDSVVASVADSAVTSAVDSVADSAVTSAVDSVADSVYSEAASVASAVASAVEAAVASAVESVADSAVYSAVDSAADSAVDSVVASVADSAVDSVVASAADSAVTSAVDSVADSAVESAADSVVESVADSAVDSVALERYLRAVVVRVSKCEAWRWLRWYNYGNLRQWYLVRYEFYRNVASVVKQNATLDALTKYTESAGPCYLFKDLAIVCDRPELFLRKTNGEFHNSNGPVIRWRDGVAVYYWHGTIVPKRVIESPESYTRKEILAIRNSEIIRALAEKLGWDKFVEKLGAKAVSSQRILSDGEDGQTVELAYELLECEDRFDERQPKWLRMQSPVLKDGSKPWYVEPVDPGLETAQAARTWRTRRADGSWPTVAECNDGLMPDWTVRQGDLVFHRIGFEEAEALIDNGARRAQGANLVTGASTGHSHTLVFEHELYDLKDGRKLILRTGNTLCVTHDEHKTVTLDRVWTVQSVARQYDREHGWINVED